MPATIETVKVLSVRLPEPEIRKLKTIAASKGMSVQEAVHRAVESWLLSNSLNPGIESLLSLQGSMAGGDDVDTMRNKERELEFSQDARWLSA